LVTCTVVRCKIWSLSAARKKRLGGTRTILKILQW